MAAPAAGPWVLLGAHLLPSDIEAVEGVTPFTAGEIWVSGLPYNETTGTADRSLITAAARARQQLLDQATFIAIRYGVSVRSQADAAAQCSPLAARWRRVLEASVGLVEVTLKIATRGGLPGRPDRHAAPSGRSYLEELHRMRRRDGVDPEFKAAATGLLTAGARKWLWQPRDDGGMELVLLIPKDNMAAMKECGVSLKERFPGTPFLLSGPWPLEVFADEQ